MDLQGFCATLIARVNLPLKVLYSKTSWISLLSLLFGKTSSAFKGISA